MVGPTRLVAASFFPVPGPPPRLMPPVRSPSQVDAPGPAVNAWLCPPPSAPQVDARLQPTALRVWPQAKSRLLDCQSVPAEARFSPASQGRIPMPPRFILPGVTYLLTRRCAGRQLLLRPDPKVNQIFKFCLAVAAQRTGVAIHAFCVLSNHYHIVATDLHGNLPVFMHWLNEYVAKCLNSHWGRWESFWAPGSYSAVALADDEAVVAALVYTYTNPVNARLVRTHTDWPGAISMPADMDGEAELVDRPTGFFRDRGPVPESASLRVALPARLGGDRSGQRMTVSERVRARESEICSRHDETGQRFLGRKAVLRLSPFSRPRGTERRGGLNPRVATRDKWRRIHALQRLKHFLGAYRAAWKAFCGGKRSVVFPLGTYAMRVRFGVCCHGP